MCFFFRFFEEKKIEGLSKFDHFFVHDIVRVNENGNLFLLSQH